MSDDVIQELPKRKSFLENEGSLFDDQVEDAKRNAAMLARMLRLKERVPAEITDEQLPFYLEVLERPHATVWVKGPTQAIGFRGLLVHWFDNGWLPRGVPGVSLNRKLGLSEVRVD
jgi:hypothetical protein